MGLNFFKKAVIYGILVATAFLSGCGYDSRVQDKDGTRKTLEKRVSQVETVGSEREKYAILINGDFSSLHKYNISHAYETLRDKLGFDEENIFILSSNYPRPDASVNNPLLVTSQGTKENLMQVVDYLSTIVDDNDLLVLYGTGHGDKRDNQSWICLDGQDVSAKEYEKMLEKMNAETIVSVMDQCYSGGFSQELADTKARAIAVTNTDGEHTTYCKYFSEAFWNSFGNAKADSNNDGSISVQEAYKSAMDRHKEELSSREKETNGQFVCSNGKIDVILK